MRPKYGKRESRRMKIEVKRVMPTRIALIGFKILSKAVVIFLEECV